MSTDNEHSLIYSKVEVRNDVMQVYDSMMCTQCNNALYILYRCRML